MKVTDFSGTECCYQYDREYLDRFGDCLKFYFDGKLRFERHFHGEGACLVYGAWGNLSEDGTIIYDTPFDKEVVPEELPKKITKIDGDILYLDENFRKWTLAYKLKEDKLNGYSKSKILVKKMFKTDK